MVPQNEKGFKIKNFSKKPDVRYLFDLEKVIFDKEWFKKAKNFPLYYMFRGVKEKGNIRYDITIIPPAKLGKEFVKTLGHFHEGDFGELYKVLAGRGIFLLQKGKEKVEDVYFVEGKKGDYILIPPGYGHVTINPSNKILKIANWVLKDCQSNYQIVEKKRGLCYYFTIDGWVKNKNYKKVPPLKEKKPLLKMPKDLSFLGKNL